MAASQNESGIVRLIVAIDFGTAYSSVVYYHYRPDQVPNFTPGTLILSHLKDVYFEDSNQAKTELAWNPSISDWVWGNDMDHSVNNRQVKDSDRFRLLKLGLEGLDYTTVHRKLSKQISQLPPESHVSSVYDLVVIYLRRLYEAARVNIEAQVGKVGHRSIFDIADVECVLSVPAMWDMQMNSKMVQAAAEAGMPHAWVVTEPEAAAIYMLHEEPQRQSVFGPRVIHEHGPEGIPLLIADVGGGTAVSDLYFVTFSPNCVATRSSKQPIRHNQGP